MSILRSCILRFAAVIMLAAGASAKAADEAGPEFFEKQVRPILVARCYECHSAQAAKLKGGLRLDSLAAALQGGDTGPALVPGRPKESLLVDAINYGDVYQMPPKSKLAVEEIAVLTKWVELGAPWPADKATSAAAKAGSEFNLARRKAEHWCWQPVNNSAPPPVKNEAWIKQPLDRFILAKLEEKNLAPSLPADPRTLIRRAYFDLIGLPPTAEELEELLSVDCRYEVLINRLLASPRFGERWARHWLDLVRYAESRGHEFDYNIPNTYEYRDYVIRALNADVPYDQFVVEHVAGDLLEQPRLNPTEGFNESIVGSGFWFLGEWCHSPVDIRKDECDRIDNMLDVFSKTFLGVTVACARCHDHKFDAISQRDYYSLAGYLQSSSYRLARFETWQQDQKMAAELTAMDAKHRPRIAAAAVKSLGAKLDEIAKLLAANAEQLQGELGVAETDVKGAEVIVDYSALPPGAWMTNGPTFGRGPVRAGQLILGTEATSPLEVAAYGAARRDPAWGDLGLATTSENDPARLGGWLRAGRTLKTPTFTLTSGYVHYLIKGAGDVYAAVDSHLMNNGPLHTALIKETGGNSELPTRWITHDLSRYVGHRVHLEFSPKEEEDFRVLMVVQGKDRPAAPKDRPNKLLANLLTAGPADARLALSLQIIRNTLDQLAADQIAADPQPRDRAALVNWLIAQGGFDQNAPQELSESFAAYKAERERTNAHIQAKSRLCIAMWDGSGVDENLLIRGNSKTVGPTVPRRMLEAVEGSEFRVQGAGGSGRLELARQLVDPNNPLVARVIVNRVWQHLMGRGIVPSVDNFGVLGQPPTHPELLDYLARQFVQDGWSLKRLIRRIMLSSTYRQGSGFRVQGLAEGGAGAQLSSLAAEAADPQNLLFHRQNLKRLEGEALRDAMLAISGRLEPTMYGPSVPVYLTSFMQGRGRPKESGPLDGAGRRSVYIAVRRNFLSPLMLAFDTPIPFSTIGGRNVSNVPAQALILMNDSFVAEQSRLWARQLLVDKSAPPQDRIRRMYLAAFGREPTVSELTVGLAFVGEQTQEYGIVGDTAVAAERAWADFGHVLFNVKEFVFVD
jgi:cytochrome c553